MSFTPPAGFFASQRAFGGDAPELDPEILARVAKPSRYLGGELGQVKKDLSQVDATVGLCYPDLYEIGMSHIGLKILYSIVNNEEDLSAQRVYAVAPDMEAQLRARGLPLRTLENRIPLSELDVLGFTLQYELSYSNLLQVLDLGGIPLRSEDRERNDPVVIAGGPCAFNPEPLAAYIDAVCLGDGEITILAVVRAVQDWKKTSRPRGDLLRALTQIPGVYVPSLYDVAYLDDGRVAAITPREGLGLPQRIRKAILPDLDSSPFHTATPVPFMQVVHDRVGVEIQRGCMRGCRFCQAGYIYRPERQRSPETIQRLVREGLAATGQEEYSLLSLSAGDYSCMEPLLGALMDEHEQGRSAISLPSMRLETLTPGIMDQISRVRKTSFTVAPEAASDRLRAVINKVIDEDVLIDMVGQVFQRGWKGLKFYFMLGLPTEQQEDLEAMVDLGARCLHRARRYNRAANITMSVSSFVPKSHTPFQWARQITLDQIREKQDYLRRELRRAKLGFRYHDSRSSVMEGVFSRGDRRTGDALLRAYQLGARLDGWQEQFSEDAWYQAFDETGIDPTFTNQRRRDATEVFPWQHIDIGMKPEWLWEDWMDSLEAGFVPDCTTEPCYDCGVCDHEVIHNRVFKSPEPDAKPQHRFRKPYQGSRKAEDPQFVAMPRPPAKKGNNVVDAVPPQGMAPGSASARGVRRAYQAGEAAAANGSPSPAHPEPPKPKLDSKGRPKPSKVGAEKDGDWSDVFDRRLPENMRARLEIRYGKVGALVHLGHLEVMASFRRALKRAGLPVLWSQGFHPQLKLAFGDPLPAGMASVTEFAELDVKRPFDLADATARLQAAMPDELPIYSVREVPWSGKSLQARTTSFRYRVQAPESAVDEAAAAVERFLAADSVLVERERKGKTIQLDVRPAITSLQPALDEPTPGAWDLVLPAIGGGVRIRDVLGGIFGPDAGLGVRGWFVVRVETVRTEREGSLTPPHPSFRSVIAAARGVAAPGAAAPAAPASTQEQAAT